MPLGILLQSHPLQPALLHRINLLGDIIGEGLGGVSLEDVDSLSPQQFSTALGIRGLGSAPVKDGRGPEFPEVP